MGRILILFIAVTVCSGAFAVALPVFKTLQEKPQSDEVNRGFRTVFEPSVTSIISPTTKDYMPGPSRQDESSTEPLTQRIGVNRRCIQNVNFNKKPWDFKIRDAVVGAQDDREITYLDKDGCIQTVKFAPGSDTPLATAQTERDEDWSFADPEETQVGLDLGKHTKNLIHVTPENLAILMKKVEEED